MIERGTKHPDNLVKQFAESQIDMAIWFFLQQLPYMPASLEVYRSRNGNAPFWSTGLDFKAQKECAGLVLAASWIRDGELLVIRSKQVDSRVLIRMGLQCWSLWDFSKRIARKADELEIQYVNVPMGSLEHRNKMEEYVLSSSLKGV
jgi:hypothetical protein